MSRDNCERIHNFLARVSDVYKIEIRPEPVKMKQGPCPDYYKKYRIYKEIKERDGNGEAYLAPDEEEMFLSVCRNEEEIGLMKSCTYAYQYPANLVLKSFRDDKKEKSIRKAGPEPVKPPQPEGNKETATEITKENIKETTRETTRESNRETARENSHESARERQREHNPEGRRERNRDRNPEGRRERNLERNGERTLEGRRERGRERFRREGRHSAKAENVKNENAKTEPVKTDH